MSYLTAAARLARRSHVSWQSAYVIMRDGIGCCADRKGAGTVFVLGERAATSVRFNTQHPLSCKHTL